MAEPMFCTMASGRPFGGQYVPESLVESLDNLQEAFDDFWNDIKCQREFKMYLSILRPTFHLHKAQKLTQAVGSAQIYLKREDLNHNGGHFIPNALGQALFARRLNKRTILAETGSGGHGIATAAACRLLGLKCIVYIGAKDAETRREEVKRIQTYGAEVVEVCSGGGTIREAITEVLRAAVEQYETAYPLLGGAYGPRPLPSIANAFQQIVGTEIKAQMWQATGGTPNAVVACAGVHSPGTGAFYSFISDRHTTLLAVEGAGCGLESELHAAVLTKGSPGVYHGAHTMVLQDEHGQIDIVHSIAPDLCYPSASPWLAEWVSRGRVEVTAVADDEAYFGSVLLSKIEGIDCSIEDGHAIAAGVEIASTMTCGQTVVICIGMRA